MLPDHSRVLEMSAVPCDSILLWEVPNMNGGGTWGQTKFNEVEAQ